MQKPMALRAKRASGSCRRLGRPRAWRRAPFARVGEQGRRSQGEGQKDHGGPDQVGGGRHAASGDEGARGGAGDSADAEHGVEARDGRRAEQFLGGDGLRVHGDIVGARHGAVKQQRGEERRRVVRQRNGEQRKAESDGGPACDRATAAAYDQRAAERNRGDGADRRAQQREAESAVAQVQRGFHGGDARHPRRDHQAVYQEARHHAPKGAAVFGTSAGARQSGALQVRNVQGLAHGCTRVTFRQWRIRPRSRIPWRRG